MQERSTIADVPPVRGSNPCGDQTVYDSVHQVCWLADGDLAATEKFGVSGINPDGSMPFDAAHKWLKALNTSNDGKGWLGHNTWLLPTTTAVDRDCTKHNRAGGGGFGYDCSGSALGALYYKVLGLSAKSNVLPIKGSANGPFKNLQANIYWSGTAAANASQGYQSFSFNTGWQGANTITNVLFALPMVSGRLPGTPPPKGTALEIGPGGLTVYDPISDVTWVSDGNLAASNPLNVPGVGKDGAMDKKTADAWIVALRSARYAGSDQWQLPDIGQCGGFGCKNSVMAQLYTHLQLKPGESVNNDGATVAGFRNLRPYMYWSCNGDAVPGSCSGQLPRGMGWSLSFSNGFQGTDLPTNALYVLPYYPAPTSPPKCQNPIQCCAAAGGYFHNGHCE